MGEIISGWHFLAPNGLLRDGRKPPPVGEWLVHGGSIEPCVSGLHLSERAIDALQYAPGPLVCLVSARGGIIRHGGDKIVCRERRIDAGPVDAAEALKSFARRCALDVIYLWDAPAIVHQYLEGDGAARSAAWSAADAEAEAAAAWAAWSAAWSAADAEAEAAAAWAARTAAWSAAWSAAAAAARDRQTERLEKMLRELLGVA